jgi:hypothetical protein
MRQMFPADLQAAICIAFERKILYNMVIQFGYIRSINEVNVSRRSAGSNRLSSYLNH